MAEAQVFPRVEVAERGRGRHHGGRTRDVVDLLPRGLFSNELR